MPTEEINILNIDVEPSQPEGFDVQLDLQQPNSPTLSLGVVLPIGQGGAIKSISVNGVEQPIIEGNVDITVPTSTSQLVNDSGFITSAAISGKVDRTELAQVAFSGDYDDLENKPEIPSLNGYATETYVGNAIATHNSSSEAHSDIRGSIAAINSKIPSQATPDNQLADKNFVNSSISTETATFRGTYNEVTDLNLAPEATHSMIETALHTTITTVDNNDYVFVQIPTRISTPDEIASVERYKYSSIYGWQYEYTLNNSGFTAAQWAAINSGITTGLVTQIGTSADDIATIQSAITQLNTDVSGKVSKSGDTMTGDLQMDSSIRFGDEATSNSYKLVKEGGYFRLYRYSSNIWKQQFQISTDDLVVRGNVYANGTSSAAQRKLLMKSEIDNPTIPSSPTGLLTGGITTLNELGTIDYATIALPATPGTAEYNGTFTSSTAGDIRNNTGLSAITKWQGDVTIEANATYSFCFQNGSGIIVKML